MVGTEGVENIDVSIGTTGKKSMGRNTHFRWGQPAVLQYSLFEKFLDM